MHRLARARAHDRAGIVCARIPSCENNCEPSERQKNRGERSEEEEEMAKGEEGKKRFPGFEWLRMSPIKRRLFWLYSARGGIDEAKGLLFVASRRVTERDAAAASAPLV